MMGGVKHRRVIAAVSLSAALTLSACGGPGSEPGVSVDGTDYSVADLQQAVQDLTSVAQMPSTTSDVIRDLAVLPVLKDIVDGTPAQVSEGEIRSILAENGVADPSRATVDSATARQYLQSLNDPAVMQDPGMADAVAKMQAVTEETFEQIDVEVNPRYGEWDVSTGVVPSTPSWIKSDQSGR